MTERDMVANASALAETTALAAGLQRALPPSLRPLFDGAFLRLRPGTSIDRVGAAANQLAARYPGTGGAVFVADERQQAASVERAVRPQAVALVPSLRAID